MYKGNIIIQENSNNDWKQHFPTYKFNDRDIALEEYKVSSKLLESEERIFLNASNLTLIFATAVGSLIVSYNDKISNLFKATISSTNLVKCKLLLTLLY